MEEFNYKEMLAEAKAKADAQAKQYFYNQKQRKPYYYVEGTSLDDDNFEAAYLHFTDEEVSRIQTLIIEDVNSIDLVEKPVSTVKEALEVLNYGDLFDQNEELCHLLLDRCEKANVYPSEVDFDNKHYYYKFSCVAYDYVNNTVSNPISVAIFLTDEEYITLLSFQLEDRKGFTFNQLLIKNPELGIKLSKEIEGCIYGWCYSERVPFTILFDEVRADAEAIDGPIPADGIVFFEYDEHMYHVLAAAASHVLTITEEDMKPDAGFSDRRILKDIDAEKVMELLQAKNYADLIEKLKLNFNNREAFDKIKSWLTSNQITFSEVISE